MSEYVSTIIYIAVFSIILQLILPNNKLKKYIGVLVSLVIILTLVSPVIDILKNEEVISVISNAVKTVQSNVKIKQYNLVGFKDKIILSSTKENIEKEIHTSCVEKFGIKFSVTKVKINLSDDYTIEDIDIYVERLDSIADAGEIIDYIAKEYTIDASVINVIREE